MSLLLQLCRQYKVCVADSFQLTTEKLKLSFNSFQTLSLTLNWYLMQIKSNACWYWDPVSVHYSNLHTTTVTAFDTVIPPTTALWEDDCLNDCGCNLQSCISQSKWPLLMCHGELISSSTWELNAHSLFVHAQLVQALVIAWFNWTTVLVPRENWFIDGKYVWLCYSRWRYVFFPVDLASCKQVSKRLADFVLNSENMVNFTALHTSYLHFTFGMN